MSERKDMYVSWAGDDVTQQQEAFRAMSDAVDKYNGIMHSSAGFHTDLSNLASNVSGRPGLDRRDYGHFRPEESIPTRIRDIIKESDKIYRRTGLIRNITDLMSDFACQGIRIVHPNKRIEKFSRVWWQRVEGNDRSERFANILIRLANVIVRRMTAKISVPDINNNMKTVASPDMDITRMSTNKRTIPWKYVLLDPTVVDVSGGELSSFTDNPTFSLRLPENLKRIIKSPSTKEEKELVRQLPPEIRKAAKSSQPIPLPPDKTRAFYYKKDDWNPWAYPMIYSVMADIVLLEKLKLADQAALDGAISNIRIFKLGSLEHKIAPTRAAASKLSEILQSHTAAGTMDLVWGPDIELIESKTQVHQFLGDAKYAAVLNSIYAAMGIPPTLTGSGSGTTNNYISLQTLVQRLEYVRSVLLSFWNYEFRLLQQAMGWRFAPTLEFEHSSFGNPEAENALLVQLADRNLVSDELLQYRFGHNPDMEKIRINRESKDRESGKTVPKAGAFHDPQFEVAYKKLLLQTGAAAPSEVGLELETKKKGEKNALEIKAATMPKPTAPGSKKGVSGQGRPKNKKDSVPRKEKKFVPKSKAVVEIWAGMAQEAIAEAVTPIYLEQVGKATARQLTSDEIDMLERIKFDTLCVFEPASMVDKQTILSALQTEVQDSRYDEYGAWVTSIASDLNRPLTLEEKRQIQKIIYVELKGEDDG